MDLRNYQTIQEAYMEVFEKQQLNEISMRRAIRALKAAERRTDSSNDKDFQSKMASGAEKYSPDDYSDETRKNLDKENKIRSYIDKKRTQREQVDTYDLILFHLLDEGYAETPEAAEVIMVNMSEEWREDIVEELTGERKKRALEKGGYLANRVAMGKEGQPLERRNRSGDVTMRTTTKGPTKRGGIGFKGRTKSDWYGTDDAHGSGNKSRRRRGLEVKDTSDEL